MFDSDWDDTLGRTGSLLFGVTPAPAVDPTVEVVDGGGLFATGPAPVTAQPGGGYLASLPYPDSVAAGTYTGHVVVRICEDAGCQRPFALPLDPLTYGVTVYHVVSGLPPLTASFLLDGVAVQDAVEDVNLAGERTYAVAAHVGQVLDVTLSEAPIVTRRPITGATATLTREAGSYPPARYRITSIQSGLTSGTGFLNFRVADGRWLRLTVNATP